MSFLPPPSNFGRAETDVHGQVSPGSLGFHFPKLAAEVALSPVLDFATEEIVFFFPFFSEGGVAFNLRSYTAN